MKESMDLCINFYRMSSMDQALCQVLSQISSNFNTVTLLYPSQGWDSSVPNQTRALKISIKYNPNEVWRSR